MDVSGFDGSDTFALLENVQEQNEPKEEQPQENTNMENENKPQVKKEKKVKKKVVSFDEVVPESSLLDTVCAMFRDNDYFIYIVALVALLIAYYFVPN